LSQSTRVTDGQTDGQADRQTDRILIAIPRLHYMQRGKNISYVFNANILYPEWKKVRDSSWAA